MDSEDYSDKKSNSDNISNDSDFPKPIWVRYFSLQTDTINKRLLEYNVRSVFIGLSIIVIILSIF